MKKVFLCSFLILFIGFSIDASAKGKKRKKARQACSQGQIFVQLGGGFPSLNNPTVDDLKPYGTIKTIYHPPLYGSFGYGVIDNLDAGLLVAYSSFAATVTDVTDPVYTQGLNYSFITVGARAAYHLRLVKSLKNLDTYANVMVGYKISKVTKVGFDFFEPKNTGGFAYAFNVGANYMFIPNVGIFAEVGYGITIVNAGITVKF